MAGIYNLLCLVTIAIMFNNVIAVNYCELGSCTIKRSHTMCKYSSKPAAACGYSPKIGLSDAEKKSIVNKHNELRQKVASGKETRGQPGPQPPAVSMPNLTWNKNLAEIAQKWANQCNFSHDTCRNVEKFVVGQNMAQISFSGKNTAAVKSMVQLWYDEVIKFNKDMIKKYKFEYKTGHYTQVVWANTTEIGCGSIEYKDSKNWTKKNLVCNYGPSGNWNDQKIYEVKK